MNKILLIVLAIISANSHALEKIYQVDKFGNTQYHLPSYVVKNDKVYQADKFGNIQYHKPALRIKK